LKIDLLHFGVSGGLREGFKWGLRGGFWGGKLVSWLPLGFNHGKYPKTTIINFFSNLSFAYSYIPYNAQISKKTEGANSSLYYRYINLEKKLKEVKP
jgi:hypothetical protein